jgi:hypothetical protein
MKYCEKCGTQYSDEASFCGKCGGELKYGGPTYSYNEGDVDHDRPDPDYGSGTGHEYGGDFNHDDDYRRDYWTDHRDGYGSALYVPEYRSLVLCIVLSIVTFGIYHLYWMYLLNNDINAVANDPEATSGGKVILFTIITLGIYGLYWYYNMGRKIDYIRRTPYERSHILYLVLAIFRFGIVNDALMQDTLNHIAEH